MEQLSHKETIYSRHVSAEILAMWRLIIITHSLTQIDK